MTEYTTDPEAISHYLAARARTAKWVDSLSGKTLVGPSIAPSLVSDTDDGLSSQDSDAESSHSIPPRMVLRYPDGRPDVTVSGVGKWPSQGQMPTGNTSSTYNGRSRPGSHGHHPSNPNINSRAPSNAAPLYVIPPAIHPETIHVRPSPTSPNTQQSPDSYFSPPDSHNPPLSSLRSRSMRSSRPPLQMIYAPPPVPSSHSHSHSAPVSPTHEGFQHTQHPPPPVPPIAAPSPVYGFPSASSPHEPPQAAPPTNSRIHSRTHSYSSNHSYPHPPAPNHGPPSSYHSGSVQRPRRHSARTASSAHPDAPQLPRLDSQSGSHIGSGSNGTFPTRRHGPPSIVYAPSLNSSSYAYNPPLITSNPPHPSMTIHAPVPQPAHPQRMAQSISDPTPQGGSLGRNSIRGRLFEDFSRTPSPGTARARAKESKKKDKSRKDKSRRRQRDRGGADNDEDGASVSSGSTYYVIPGPGQKIKVVPPTSMNGLYAEPTAASASKSTPVLLSHRSPNGPYPPQPHPPQSYKRSLLQRIFHPQFVFGSSANGTYGSSSSRRR